MTDTWHGRTGEKVLNATNATVAFLFFWVNWVDLWMQCHNSLHLFKWWTRTLLFINKLYMHDKVHVLTPTVYDCKYGASACLLAN